MLQTTLCAPLLVYDWITVIRYSMEHQRQILLSYGAYRTHLHEFDRYVQVQQNNFSAYETALASNQIRIMYKVASLTYKALHSGQS